MQSRLHIDSAMRVASVHPTKTFNPYGHEITIGLAIVYTMMI